MLDSQPEVGDNRFELGKGFDACDLVLCSYTSNCASDIEVQETAACVKAYPSPPMSGSLPPSSAGAPTASNPSQNRDTRQISNTQDGSRGLGHNLLSRESPSPALTAGPSAQVYQPDVSNMGPYAFRRPEAPSGRPLSYPQGLGPGAPQHQYMHPSPGISTVSYPLTARPQTMEHPPYTSPKSQRKTKGHVASACVPCKKAHLRSVHSASKRNTLLTLCRCDCKYFTVSPDCLELDLWYRHARWWNVRDNLMIHSESSV